MPAKKVRAKTTKSVRGKRTIGLTSAIGPKATTAVVVVVLAGGIWFGSHQRVSAKSRTPVAAVETEISDVTAAPTTSASTPPAAPKMHEPSAGATSASATVKAPHVPVTTLEGCLEQNGDTFRLKNTSGADAPKSRSWKSGFLKKGAATVDLVDVSDSLGLANRVGTRVSVSGTLNDREMQARSIHRVASSCS
jgi:hypothetical protein